LRITLDLLGRIREIRNGKRGRGCLVSSTADSLEFESRGIERGVSLASRRACFLFSKINKVQCYKSKYIYTYIH